LIESSGCWFMICYCDKELPFRAYTNPEYRAHCGLFSRSEPYRALIIMIAIVALFG
jgi:hypothetical protein